MWRGEKGIREQLKCNRAGTSDAQAALSRYSVPYLRIVRITNARGYARALLFLTRDTLVTPRHPTL